MAAYYNEFDPKAAAWLRELIKAGLIADGEVDERSIELVRPDDLRGFVQCHFFAGIGGWSYALRLAGWPDDREVWTGSCPCQAFSSATRGRSVAADMWPSFRRLVVAARPRVVFGEQVSVARSWMDRVCDEMEDADYAVAACVLPACSVGADHIRERFYFACHADSDSEPRRPVDAKAPRLQGNRSDARGVVQKDGVSRDVVALSGFGNAIVPQVAAEVIAAYMEIAQ